MPKLHFLSAAVGFGIAGLLALTTSQASPPPATLNPAAIRIEYMPHPRDMVQIKEGTPYTVPAGKLFVLTGLGATTTSSCAFGARLIVNGVQEVEGLQTATTGVSLQLAPLGFTTPPGSMIAVEACLSGQLGRAWGYLASQ